MIRGYVGAAKEGHVDERKQVTFMDRALRWNAIAALAAAAFISDLPLIIWAWRSDLHLRMTDDLAAVNSAANLAVLIIGVVEMHSNASEIKQVTASSEGSDDADRAEVMRQAKKRLAWMLLWVWACVLLSSALSLNVLWGAIDGHGPAAWLAWYSWICTGLGMTLVLAVWLGKAMNEIAPILDGMSERLDAEEPGAQPTEGTGNDVTLGTN